MKLHWLIFAVLTFATALAHSQQIVDGPDGKKILLKQDGSWEYIDETTLITTPDGRRARINDDNTWEYVETARPATQTPAAASRDENGVVMISMNRAQSQPQTNSSALEYTIDRVSIVEVETRAGVSKGTRRDSAVYFNVEIDSAVDSTLPAIDPRALSVKDSRGDSYNVVEATLSTQNISPGNPALLKVVTDDSPMRIFNAREIYLDVAVGALGNPEPLRISQPMTFVDRLDGMP